MSAYEEIMVILHSMGRNTQYGGDLDALIQAIGKVIDSRMGHGAPYRSDGVKDTR